MALYSFLRQPFNMSASHCSPEILFPSPLIPSGLVLSIAGSGIRWRSARVRNADGRNVARFLKQSSRMQETGCSSRLSGKQERIDRYVCCG